MSINLSKATTKKATTKKATTKKINEVKEVDKNMELATADPIESATAETVTEIPAPAPAPAEVPTETTEAEPPAESSAESVAESTPTESATEPPAESVPVPAESEESQESEAEQPTEPPAESEATPTESPAPAEPSNEEKEESEKAKKERLKIESMQDEMYPYFSVPLNIDEMPLDEKRNVLIDVVEKNNPFLNIWQGLINNMEKRAPRAYMRSVEYIRIYEPNLKAIKQENKKARSLLLATYSTLPNEVLATAENIYNDITVSDWNKGKIKEIVERSKNNLASQVVFEDYEDTYIKLFIKFGAPSFVVAEVSKDIRSLLKENGYKYTDDYETEAKELPGVGKVKALEGMLYEKKN